MTGSASQNLLRDVNLALGLRSPFIVKGLLVRPDLVYINLALGHQAVFVFLTIKAYVLSKFFLDAIETSLEEAPSGFNYDLLRFHHLHQVDIYVGRGAADHAILPLSFRTT